MDVARFWANISHELRTPLNSIIGLTRLLAEPAPDGTTLDPERRYQVELIRNSGSTLLALVNDLLDVAKAESGRLHVDPAQVNLPAQFGRLRGLARPMAEGKPVEVIVSDDGVPEEILTDEVALTGILRNLLSNGIKYTDRGEVRLSARVRGLRLEISVADTGIGIPVGLTGHVFEEFYQVPGMLSGIAEHVVEAEDGRQALRDVSENPVSLVLADMRMPGLDGGALLARLPATVSAVIIITGADGPAPPRAAALLRKDELTPERLEFTIRGVLREAA
jgi:signal transduction histidine kinase